MKHELSYSAPIVISESAVIVGNSERRVLIIFTCYNPYLILKFAKKYSWKWFSSPYSTFSGPFKEQFLFFCFCVWIRPSHCGQTDKQYNWTVTRSAVAFERVKTIYFLLWVMAFERVKKRTTLFFGLNDCLWKCQIREPFQLPLSAMSLERVISNILFTRLFTWSLSKQSL